MAIRFAPLRLPLERRMQTLGVLHWVFAFIALPQFCLAAFILLLFTDYWYIAAIYAGWLYLDRETPAMGGRRSTRIRNWMIWRYFRDYFPITLVRTAELDPKHNYLFGFHPHGVLVAGAFGNFCTEATGFSRLFPGLTAYLMMLPFWFKIPFFRDYIMCGSLVSSEKQSANHILNQQGGGHVAVLVVGGAPEALDAHPGALTLQVLERKGFVKMALKTGAHLVPVFSFGENELFNQVANPRGSVLRTVQDKMQKLMGLAIPLFHARGVFQYSFGLMPFRNPVTTVGLDMAAPVVVMSQPQVTTTVITSQQNGWSTGMCDCCDDLGICCFAAWCMPCFMCKTVDTFGECLCLPLLDTSCNACGYVSLGAIPPISLAMRVGVRERYKIPGSICNDCCIMYWCNCCGWCQLAREMKKRKNAVTVINATTSVLPHPTYMAQPAYASQPAYVPQPVYPPDSHQVAPPYQK